MTLITHPHHHHDATLEDTFDFLNTAELDGSGRPIEHLGSLSDVTGWLEDHGLLAASRRRPIDAPPAARASRSLAHVIAVRAGLRDLVEALVAGRAVDPRALDTLNAVLRARSPLQLVPDEGGVALAHRPVGDPLGDALAALTEPLVAAIATGATDRIRICANDGCRWVFQDASRTGRRRWCSMSSCGNRAKAARHRARRRSSALTAGPADGVDPAQPGVRTHSDGR